MRVSISHHTVRKGFVLKTTYYEVHLMVAFTHEEKQVIRQRNLLGSKLLNRRPANARLTDRDETLELRADQLQRVKHNRSIKQPVALAMFLLSRISAIKLMLSNRFAMTATIDLGKRLHPARLVL